MKKRRVGLVVAINMAVVAAYWVLVLCTMQSGIGARYGQYDLFLTVSLLRSLFIPLMVILVGAPFFFMEGLAVWQYLLVSLLPPVILEVLGNFVAMLLYRQSFGEASYALQMSFHLFMYAVVVLILWGILSAARGIARAIKKKKQALGATDAQSEREREQKSLPPRQLASGKLLHGYTSDGLLLVWYWMRWLVLCVMLAFFASGLVVVAIFNTKNPLAVFITMGVGALLSVVIALVRGVMKVEVYTDRVLVKRRGKAVGAYAFKNTRMTANKVVHLIGSVIPFVTDRYLVLTDQSGYSYPMHCRNFSEKTYVAMMDEIGFIQRAMTREAEENARRTAPSLCETQGPETARPNILPMPGEDDFVSLEFSINKGQMVSVEERRYQNANFGFFVCSVGLYAAWYFLVYRAAPAPMPNIELITAMLIATVFFVLPIVVATTRFAQEKKRIPLSIVVENDRFTVDDKIFLCAQVQGFQMTHPQGAKVGTTSHRMHIQFRHGGKRVVYTIGSGTVPKANFPDYALLYRSFEMQRAALSQPKTMRQARRMEQVTIKLTPCTTATVKVPRQTDIIV